jgi:hypothetical protein
MDRIQHLRRHEIDTERWDACVAAAPNGRLYGTTAFLDRMADAWDGIVMDDYRAVLPLPRRRKFGLDYLCPMPFSGPLAVYGKAPLTQDTLDFLRQVPARYRLWDLNLEVHGRELPWPTIARTNHVLPLDSPYTTLAANYRDSLRRTLAQEPPANEHLRVGISFDSLMEDALRTGAMTGTRPVDRARLKGLYDDLRLRERAFTLAWMQEGRTVAGALFFRSPGRTYYIAAWSGPEGRRCSAAARLLDAVIQEYAGQDGVLDFEGSDLPGPAFFFEGFGATKTTYRLLQRRRFPLLW